MASINKTFKKGTEYLFSLSQIPEINTDNVSIAEISDSDSYLDCRIINNTTFGLTYNNDSVDDFVSHILLIVNGVSGYDDLEISFEINGEVSLTPFILVNNGDTPVDIAFSVNSPYINYVRRKIYHCEGLEEGEYKNDDVVYNSSLIGVGTIPPHQKMFLKTTLNSLRYYDNNGTLVNIGITFYSTVDFSNITFEGNINALVNYNNKRVGNLYPSFANLFKGNNTIKVTPDLSVVEKLFGSSGDGTFYQMFQNCTNLTTVVGWPNCKEAEPTSCYAMFYGCTSLKDVPSILPATTLGGGCYQQMFRGCTSLTTAPELPATRLASSCYDSIFYGCTSLTTAPSILPATTLMTYCYSQMFYGCTNLTTAPELPATTLVNSCYFYMFYDCTSLTTAPELPATTLAINCYFGMFQNCTSLTTAPVLPATTLEQSCYYTMFQGCTSLTTAPELPATTLVSSCYGGMFRTCSKLSYVKAMFTTEPSSTYTSDWLYSVASTGTFVKNANATWDVRGYYGVPNGWTIVTSLD